MTDTSSCTSTRTSTCDVVDGLSRAFARRRNGGTVYVGGESDPTPGDVRAAEIFMRDLIDAGWRPPRASATRDVKVCVSGV